MSTRGVWIAGSFLLLSVALLLRAHAPVAESSAMFLLGCGFLAAAVQLRRHQMRRLKPRAERARR